MDILGLRNLTVMQDCLELIKAQHQIDIDLESMANIIGMRKVKKKIKSCSSLLPLHKSVYESFFVIFNNLFTVLRRMKTKPTTNKIMYKSGVLAKIHTR